MILSLRHFKGLAQSSDHIYLILVWCGGLKLYQSAFLYTKISFLVFGTVKTVHSKFDIIKYLPAINQECGNNGIDGKVVRAAGCQSNRLFQGGFNHTDGH